MRRITVYLATAFLTFLLGVWITGAWNSPTATEISYTLILPSETESTVDPMEQELLEIERQYDIAQTRQDVDFFERLEAKEFIFTDQDGKTYTKAQTMKLLDDWGPNAEFTSDDLKVQLYSNTAVVSGRTKVTGGGERGDEVGECRWIDLFIRRNGRWQILSTTLVE